MSLTKGCPIALMATQPKLTLNYIFHLYKDLTTFFKPTK